MMDALYQRFHDGLNYTSRYLYSLSPLEYLSLLFAFAIGGAIWKQKSGVKKVR